MKPLCLVLAGPNGAGKSSFYKHLPLLENFINADQIAAEMKTTIEGNVEFAAGREAMRRIDHHLGTAESFVFETTLGGHQPLKMMRQAKEKGFHVGLIFFALSSPELHIARVAQRVSQGGHHIPEDIIRRRYHSSFENLALALPIAHETAIYDNSLSTGYRLCAVVRDGELTENGLKRTSELDRRFAACIAKGLSTSLRQVLDIGR